MTLQQLTYFLAAAQHGSFTAAADVLRLARPSVSEQIAGLEAELGVALFVRAGRRLELTDAGRLLRPEAERTLAAAAEASDAVRRARTLAGGTASLGTFSTAEHLLLPGLVEDFARRHPDVAIRMVGQNSSELADAVRAGRLEAGLVALPIDADGLEVGPAVAQFEVVLRERATRRPRRRGDDRAARPGRARAPGGPLGRRGPHPPPARRPRPARGDRAPPADRGAARPRRARAGRPRPRRHGRHRRARSTGSASATGSRACRSTRRSTRRSPSSAGATPGSHRPPAR